ncbi:hypothetical protein KDN24_16235 [Bacillus sp. Bva_UNVM-123]|uniref:hypothetical protein n=1 Tax=Bacillus sp. Bva_UNVM-123 TaxID=2829798 RepID=UPI00391F8070
MRHFVRRAQFRISNSELEIVENVLFSAYFIILDLVCLSLLVSIITFPLHSTLTGAVIIFLTIIALGTSLYYFLRKWLGD